MKLPIQDRSVAGRFPGEALFASSDRDDVPLLALRPGGVPDTVEKLRGETDEVICSHTPEPLRQLVAGAGISLS